MPKDRGAPSISRFLVFPAGPTDADDLAAAHVRAWRETYRGLLPDAYLARMSEAQHARRFARALAHPGKGEVLLAAADRQGLAGYAWAGPSRTGAAGEAEVATLYLLRRAQGLGLGAQLLRGAARALAANGATSLMISVLRDNARARGFYEHLGGRPDRARQEPGPGGLVFEVAYRWPDIRTLAGDGHEG